MKNLVIACFVMISACGGEEDVYVWGDAAMGLSEAYCEAVAVCGYFSNFDDPAAEVRKCVRHSYHHLCEQADTCGAEIDAAVEVDVDACAVDLESGAHDCFVLAFYGVTPESCWPIFEADPSRSE